MPSLPNVPLLVRSRNLPIKPSANMTSSSFPRRPTTHYQYHLPLLLHTQRMMITMHICTTVGIKVIGTRIWLQSAPVQPIQHLPTANAATTGKTTAYAPIKIRDDLSVTPTLETLCTLATCSSDPTYNDADDAILNITIWNQPIVQYRMPIRPSVFTSNRSRVHPNTAVQFALIGVYDKLLNPPKIPCVSSLFTSISIIAVALSCLICLPIRFPWLKLMTDTLMNGMINR